MDWWTSLRGVELYTYWNIITNLDLRTGTGATGYLRTESEPRKKWSSLIIKNFNLDLFLRQKETTYIRKVSDLKFWKAEIILRDEDIILEEMEAKEACATRPKTKAETERCVLVLFRYVFESVWKILFKKKDFPGCLSWHGGRESKWVAGIQVREDITTIHQKCVGAA